MRVCDCDDRVVESLDRLAREVHDWAVTKFGKPNHTGLAAHVLEEAIELHEAPEDREEEADILILLFHKRTAVELAEAVRQKMAKNYRRKWNPPDERGVVNHVDDGEAA